MKCFSCGELLNQDDNFCPNCGAKQSAQNTLSNEVAPEVTSEALRLASSAGTYLGLSIVCAIFCCRLLGIPSIIFSALARSSFKVGRIEEGKNHLRIVKWMIWIGIIGGGIITLIFIANLLAEIGQELYL